MIDLTSHPGQCASLPKYTPPHYSGLTIPTRLIVDLHDTPLAIGLYSLIARQYIIAKAPVPLSTPDVLRYDPTMSRGAAIRAFARLVSGGWIIETKRSGGKSSYTPSWGFVNNSPRPWQVGQPLLGRPRRQIVLRLNQRLLDTCIGKITPHPIRTALIERYVTFPLLGLADVGAYVLCLAGHATVTGPLIRLGLVRDGRAQAVSSDQRILALASQRALESDDATTLTDRGLRRIGYVPLLTGGDPETQSQPLFFVPRHMIGSLIGRMIDPMIGHVQDDEGAFTALGRGKSSRAQGVDRSHGLEESHELQEELPPTPLADLGGGGEWHQDNKGFANNHEQASKQRVGPKRRTRSARHEADRAPNLAVPDTEATRALAAINVLPEQLAELSTMPLATIQAAIRDGQSRPGIRDLAGWAVHLLRNVRDHGWQIQPPPPRPDSPEALRAAFAQYTAAQEAVYGHEPDVMGQAALANDTPDAKFGDGVPGGAVVIDTSNPEDPPAVSGASFDLDQLWRTVLATIQAQTSRQEFRRLFRGVVLRSITDGVAIIEAPGIVFKECLENRYVGLLRELLRSHLGFPIQARIILQGAGSDSACLHESRSATRFPGRDPRPSESPGMLLIEDADRPVWLCQEHWEILPRMLRAALIGSTLDRGVIRGRTDYMTQLLQTRYATDTAALQSQYALCDTIELSASSG